MSKYSEFTEDIGKLIDRAACLGIGLRFGHAWRSPEEQMRLVRAGRSKTSNSRHLVRLAVDFIVEKGEGVSWEFEDYKELGEYWKSLNPQNVWGGDWPSLRDAGHFERRP